MWNAECMWSVECMECSVRMECRVCMECGVQKLANNDACQVTVLSILPVSAQTSEHGVLFRIILHLLLLCQVFTVASL